MNNLNFKDLNLSKEVQKAIEEMGFEEATPIQSQSIPHIFEGKDVIGQAQTGTGKTCAFGIPAIEMIGYDTDSIQVLILCPTRELCIQTAEELAKVAKYKRNIRLLPIYGGQPIDRQLMALRKRPQIIIGTPGRLMDHMRRGTLRLSNLRMIILDEADEMLNMGFREDIDTILEQVPAQRQTILFSATMSPEIMDLTSKYLSNPALIKIVHRELTVPLIEQFYIEVRESAKMEALSRIIDAGNIPLSLVFCNTKRRVDELAAHLQSRGYSAEGLHGDMSQSQRDKVMAKFRRGAIEVLIATDVAARGIDVENVEAVFNYDIPNDEEYYVHRIGRTGRAGKSGRAYTFVSGREIFKIKAIQRYAHATIMPMKLPSLLDVEEKKVGALFNRLKTVLAGNHISKYTNYIEKFLEETADDRDGNEVTTLDIAAALLKMSIGQNEADEEPVESADEFEDAMTENGMVRFFVNLGRIDRIQPRRLLELISENTSLPGKLVGAIDIYEKFTFVEVPREYAGEVLYSLKNLRHNGRRINIEKAVKRIKEGQSFRPRPRQNS